MPNEMAMFNPWISASYSAALLEAGNSNWRAYLRCSLPPYIIFSDKTLIDMAAKMPASKPEMLDVSGVEMCIRDRIIYLRRYKL